MSGGIQLSGELITAVKDLLVNHDAAADNDLVSMQYLAAICGYILAHQSSPGLDKHALLNDISTFMGQVVDQVESDLNPRQPSQDAFGIWTPDQG